MSIPHNIVMDLNNIMLVWGIKDKFEMYIYEAFGGRNIEFIVNNGLHI